MSRFRLALIIGIAGAAVIMWRNRRSGGSPLDSLEQLAAAARAHDRSAIEQYLDVSRVAESVVDQTLATAAALGDEASPELRMFEDMRSSLAALVELNIWSTLLDSPATLEEGSVANLASLDLRVLIDRYRGTAGVRQRGRVARVGVRLGLENVDSAVVVQLRMEPAAGHWRVIGVEDLEPYLRATFGRKMERAYESAMKAYLRNLATAQDAYFAKHATYGSSFEAVASFQIETPGVGIEIVAASPSGWSALARHQQSPYVCRIGVGTGVPAGAVEREVKCSAQRPD